MTPAQIDAILAAHGCHYDDGDEVFRDGARVLDIDEVCAMLPDLTLDELASYQDQKFDARGMGRDV